MSLKIEVSVTSLSEEEFEVLAEEETIFSHWAGKVDSFLKTHRPLIIKEPTVEEDDCFIVKVVEGNDPQILIASRIDPGTVHLLNLPRFLPVLPK